jgi:hypothetical protein
MMRGLVLVPLLLLPCGACAGLFSGPRGWQEVDLQEPLGKEAAWHLVAECAGTLGLPADRRLSRFGEGKFLTIWRDAPRHRMKPQRRRLRAELIPGPGGEVAGIRFRVERQLNSSMLFNPDPAEWEEAGRVPRQEELFLHHLRLRLDPGLSEYRKRKVDLQGLPDGE